MTQVVPAQSTLTVEASAVSLARYAAILRLPECAFWGVARDGDRIYECRNIWTKPERDNVARYLAEAQNEIEQVTGYFLSPRFVVGSLEDQPNRLDLYVDDQVFTGLQTARWPKVIAAGVRGVATISLGAAVNHAADPAVIGPVATTVTDANEIAVFHPGTDVEINPSSVTLAGGFVTISIPRCRMVLASLADNDESGLSYSNTANFESTVDLKRVYVDGSTNAELVSPHTCSVLCAESGCTEHTQTGCIYVVDGRLGTLSVRPATYADGAWGGSGIDCCRSLTRVRLNYRAGMAALTPQAEDTIIRLAHSKMPMAPCGCELYQWTQDHKTPDALSVERLGCPFGTSNGAWIAWKFANALRQTRGSIL